LFPSIPPPVLRVVPAHAVDEALQQSSEQKEQVNLAV
jgi:hypothetical protein